MDFSDTRERIAAMPVRFWAGVPKVPAKKKESMAIYTLFIQHVLNSLKSTGKGAIVVPTGFVTAKSGVEKKILQHIVDEHIVYGCISMPSNVFANTGTNVSVLFFDNSRKTDKVVLIDASKLGEEYKDGNNQKRRLRDLANAFNSNDKKATPIQQLSVEYNFESCEGIETCQLVTVIAEFSAIYGNKNKNIDKSYGSPGGYDGEVIETMEDLFLLALFEIYTNCVL